VIQFGALISGLDERLGGIALFQLSNSSRDQRWRKSIRATSSRI
jgi:hypothetical protein